MTRWQWCKSKFESAPLHLHHPPSTVLCRGSAPLCHCGVSDTRGQHQAAPRASRVPLNSVHSRLPRDAVSFFASTHQRTVARARPCVRACVCVITCKRGNCAFSPRAEPPPREKNCGGAQTGSARAAPPRSSARHHLTLQQVPQQQLSLPNHEQEKKTRVTQMTSFYNDKELEDELRRINCPDDDLQFEDLFNYEPACSDFAGGGDQGLSELSPLSSLGYFFHLKVTTRSAGFACVNEKRKKQEVRLTGVFCSDSHVREHVNTTRLCSSALVVEPKTCLTPSRSRSTGHDCGFNSDV